MSKSKYKIGDIVKIKSIDWYNKNKDHLGNVSGKPGEAPFVPNMRNYCGKLAKIIDVRWDSHLLDIDGRRHFWEDYMFEKETLKDLLIPGRIVEFNDEKRAMVFLNKGKKFLLYKDGYDEVDGLNYDLVSPLGHEVMKIYETDSFGNGLNYILYNIINPSFSKEVIWKRPKKIVELTMNEIANKFGVDIKLLKIKK